MEETVVPLDLGFRPEQGISSPVLVRTDEACVLTFNAVVPRADGLHHPAGHGVIEFVRCEATRFEQTREERPHHPLSEAAEGLGDAWSGVFEVLRSSWAQERREYWQSVVHTRTVEPSRHFLLVFHESVVECLAGDLRAELYDGPYADVLQRIAARIYPD